MILEFHNYISNDFADHISNEYKGQPVPSAIAPSMSAFSQDESPTKSNN
jgi:hypothetical protein